MYYSLEAVILSRRLYREHDRLVTVYSRESGRTTLLAPGAHRIRSKAFGSLTPFSTLFLSVVRGKVHDRIIGVERMDDRRIGVSVAGIGLASFGAQLVERLTPEESPEQRVYELLNHFFDAISEGFMPGKELRAVSWFSFHLLDLLGWSSEVPAQHLSDAARYIFKQMMRLPLRDIAHLLCPDGAGREVAQFADQCVREHASTLHREPRIPARDFLLFFLRQSFSQ